MSLLKTAGIQHPNVGTQSITIDGSTGVVSFPNGGPGDLTAVSAGTGISVASSSGPVPTVSIDTATTVDKTTAQTLTNKTLTTPIISSISNTGTLTLPTSTDTLVGRDTTDTLTNKTIAATSNTITGVINNTLTTTTGDLIYASGANTPARLGIGSTSQVLTVTGGVPTWATPGGGGMTLLSTTSLTGSTVTISSIPATYESLVLKIYQYSGTVDGTTIRVRFNGDSNTRYTTPNSNAAPGEFSYSVASGDMGANQDDSTTSTYFAIVEIPNYASSATWKMARVTSLGNWYLNGANAAFSNCAILYNQTTAISSIDLFPNSGNFDSGTAYLYGVK